MTDHLGTPREMFGETGDLRWAATYTTWGVVHGVRGSPPEADNDDRRAIYSRPTTYDSLALAQTIEDRQNECPIRFLGQWEDKECSLSFNRYRYYDAYVGCYTSIDPIGLYGGENTSSYVANPLVDVDVFGLRTAAPPSLPSNAQANPAAPISGVGANQAAGNAARDTIAAREAPALTEQTFKTVGGRRRVDVLKLGNKTIAIESKVGRTGLTKDTKRELARDWWLVRQGQVGGVTWEFSRSKVTGEVGPTPDLQQMLNKLGFGTRINP